jgi:hypothetical protein
MEKNVCLDRLPVHEQKIKIVFQSAQIVSAAEIFTCFDNIQLLDLATGFCLLPMKSVRPKRSNAWPLEIQGRQENEIKCMFSRGLFTDCFGKWDWIAKPKTGVTPQ